MSAVVAPKTAQAIANRAALVNRAAIAMPPPTRVHSPPVTVQLASAMKVSSPNDPAEKEAEDTAKRVMQMPAGIKRAEPAATAGAGRKSSGKTTPTAMRSPYIARMADIIVQRESTLARMIAGSAPRETALMRAMDGALIQRAGRSASEHDGRVNVSANLAAEIKNSKSSGAPLPPSVRRFMEPRFGADFSNVRVHTGEKAADLNQQLSAKAFTVGNEVFFGKGQFQPDSHDGKELLAHELTHTVQQGGAAQDKSMPVHRAVDTQLGTPVNQHTGEQVQRGLLPDPMEYIASKAESIPGFTMFTVVIGFNPITMSNVDRSAGNILRGAIQLIPGGSYITDALNNHGIFDKISAWTQTQFDTIKDIGSNIWTNIKDFVKGVGLTDLGDLGGLWEKGKAILTGPIDQMKAFAIGLKDGIVQFIKDCILKPIGAYAQTTSGYKILCGIMGHDPITGDAASLDGEALMGAFMDFIGQGDTWTTIQNAKAIPRTVAWFKQNTAILKSKVMQIPGLFVTALKSLELMDIILIPLAFVKLGKVFANFAGDFISWGAKAVWDLLEIVFDVVKPGVMGYVKRTGGAIKAILKNPAPFVSNLAAAAKLGFNNFAGSFLDHLKAGLLNWLTGALPGVYIPKSFALMELFKLGLSVLGLSWANLRVKLVKVLGEPAMAIAESAVDVIITLKNQGPTAAWEQIKGQLSNLTGMIVDGITGMVVDAVVKKAVPKVVAMFIPGAGFISAILSIVDLVQTVYAKIQQIAAVGSAIVSSIVQIAAGNIGAAAKKVESILAGMLSLAISFLAGFAGLGKVADKVMGIIQKVRAPVDKALDAAIAWVVGIAKKLLAKLTGKGKDKDKAKPDERTDAQKDKDKAAAIAEAERLVSPEGVDEEEIKHKLGPIQSRYKLTTLNLLVDSTTEEDETIHFEASASPNLKGPARKVPKSAKTTKIGSIEIPREKMGWSKSTKVELAEEFVDRTGNTSAVEKKSGKIKTKKKYGRRHIVSFADIQAHYLAGFPAGMTVEKAVKMLEKFGITAQFKKSSVHAKVRVLTRQAFNDYGRVENLWIGPQAANSSFGAKVDPSPAMLTGDKQSQQKKLDKHISEFVAHWGVPGVPFKVTGNYEWIIDT